MYNNNNRGGFYQNQNNNNNMYRPPGQNIYQQMNNNYNQPHGPFQNYNQNLFGPQTNQGPGPRPFIQGYIGRTMISSEDLQTFSKSIKEVEWTKNVNYMQAQNIPVRHKLMGLGENNRNDVYIPRHRFNDYYFNSNFNPREILDLIQEATNNNRKIKDVSIKIKNRLLQEFVVGSDKDTTNFLFKYSKDTLKEVCISRSFTQDGKHMQSLSNISYEYRMVKIKDSDLSL